MERAPDLAPGPSGRRPLVVDRPAAATASQPRPPPAGRGVGRAGIDHRRAQAVPGPAGRRAHSLLVRTRLRRGACRRSGSAGERQLSARSPTPPPPHPLPRRWSHRSSHRQRPGTPALASTAPSSSTSPRAGSPICSARCSPSRTPTCARPGCQDRPCCWPTGWSGSTPRRARSARAPSGPRPTCGPTPGTSTPRAGCLPAWSSKRAKPTCC